MARNIGAREIVGKITSELISENKIENVEGSSTDLSPIVRDIGSEIVIVTTEYKANKGAHTYSQVYDNIDKNEYANTTSIVTIGSATFYRVQISMDLTASKLSPDFYDSCSTVITTQCNDFTSKNSAGVYVTSGIRTYDNIKSIGSNIRITNKSFIDGVFKFSIDLYKSATSSSFAPYLYLVQTRIRLLGMVFEPTLKERKYNDKTKNVHCLEANELLQEAQTKNYISCSKKFVNDKYSVRANAAEPATSVLTVAALIGSEAKTFTIDIGQTVSKDFHTVPSIAYRTEVTGVTPENDGKYKYYGMVTDNFEGQASNIIEHYVGGKQTISFSVIAGEVLYKVGDVVIPHGFDGKPMSRKIDGEAKQFMITSAEFVYRGSYRQNLDMVEIT